MPSSVSYEDGPRSIHIPRQGQAAEFLYKCVEFDQMTASFVRPYRHTCYPIRLQGKIVALLDIASLEKLIPNEEREAGHLAVLLSDAFKHLKDGEITPQERSLKPKFADWHDATLDIDEFEAPTRTDILFDRAIFLDSRQRVSKLDSDSLKPLRDQPAVAPIIHNLFKGIVGMFVGFDEEMFSAPWKNLRNYLSTHLSRLIVSFDPTLPKNIELMQAAIKIIGKVPYSEFLATKNLPVVVIFTWFQTAVTLTNHAVNLSKRRPRQKSQHSNLAETSTSADATPVSDRQPHDADPFPAPAIPDPAIHADDDE